MFGRSASGEIVRRALFRDCWRIRVDGRLVHAEELAIGGDTVELLARNAVAAGCTAFATLVMIDAECERHLDAARAILGDDAARVANDRVRAREGGVGNGPVEDRPD
ncbi:MAG: urease accessory protein UreD [Gemmatimonas sp.]